MPDVLTLWRYFTEHERYQLRWEACKKEDPMSVPTPARAAFKPMDTKRNGIEKGAVVAISSSDNRFFLRMLGMLSPPLAWFPKPSPSFPLRCPPEALTAMWHYIITACALWHDVIIADGMHWQTGTLQPEHHNHIRWAVHTFRTHINTTHERYQCRTCTAQFLWQDFTLNV